MDKGRTFFVLLVFPCAGTPIRGTLPISDFSRVGVRLSEAVGHGAGYLFLVSTWWLREQNTLCSKQLLALGQDPLGEV